jgi:hypothetical protein
MKTHITKSVVAALALALVTNLHAQTPAARDPFAAGKAAAPAPPPVTEAQDENAGVVNISLAYEAFSLPIAKAGEIQRKGMPDAELYKELVTTGKLERLLVLRGRSGQRAVLENATEYRYATEFAQAHAMDPVEQPEAGNDGAKAGQPAVPAKAPVGKFLALPATPTAFEMKPVGDSLEMEPTLSPDGKIVDLQIQVTHTAGVGREKWGKGLGEVEQPGFETQKINTNATLTIGSPFLVGTLNPVFGNGVTQRDAQEVWFCFITATGVRAPGDAAKKSAH